MVYLFTKLIKNAKKNQWQKIRHIKYEVLLLSYGKLTI